MSQESKDNEVFQKYYDYLKANPGANVARKVGPEGKSVVLPLGRMAYADLLTPDVAGTAEGRGSKQPDGTTKPYYKVTGLFPKGSNFDALREVASQAYADKNGKPPTGSKWLRLVTADKQELFGKTLCPVLPEDGTQLDVKSTSQPRLFVLKPNPAAKRGVEIVPAPSGAVMSGNWAAITVTPVGFTAKGDRPAGVFMALDSVLILLKDNPLTSSTPPVDPEAAYGAVAAADEFGSDDGANPYVDEDLPY